MFVLTVLCLGAMFPVVNLANGSDDCKPFSFRLPSGYEIGANPFRSVLADFDGDGHEDLAVANNTQAQMVSVAFADGHGGFAPVRTFPSGLQPNAITSGDFNDDGKVDIAVAAGGGLAILLNDGGGGFLAPSPIPNIPGRFYTDLKVGDFNADGLDDIAALLSNGSSSQEVRVLIGIGQSEFQQASVFILNGTDGEIEVGRLNLDDTSDILIFSGQRATNRNLAFVFGRHDGQYSLTPGWPLEDKAVAMVIRDLNADGRPDFLIGFEDDITPTQSYLRSWFGTEAGGFSGGAQINTGRPWEVLAEDLDGDGFIDIGAVIAGSLLEVHYGSGGTDFGAAEFWALPTATGFVYPDDADNDGKMDLLAAQASSSGLSNEVSFIRNLGDRKFFSSKAIFTGRNRITASDLNNDGLLEFISANRTEFAWESTVEVNINGPGGFTGDVSTITPIALTDLAVGDFDGDGRSDVVSAHGNNGRRVAVYLSNGAGQIGSPISTTSNVGYKSLIVGKFNDDAIDDVFAVDESGKGHSLLGVGDGTFAPALSVPLSLPGSNVKLQTGDFNEDGKLDIVAAGQHVFLGNGAGQFTQSSLSGAGLGDFVVGDFDGDGHLDFAGFTNGKTVRANFGDGTGGFVEEFGFEFQALGEGRSLIAGDFNLDGRDDVAFVILLNGLKNLYVVPSESGRTWGEPLKYSLGGLNGYTSIIYAADYDGDGRIDIGYSDEVSRGVIYNTAGNEPCVYLADLSIMEGDSGLTNAAFTVSLSSPSAKPIRLNYIVKPGTAAIGQDLQSPSARIEIPAGQESATIIVPTIGDTIDEYDESFTVEVASAVNGYITRASATGTIVDNDLAPTISISDVSKVEGAFSNSFGFSVVLSEQSEKPISFVYSSAGGTAISGSDFAPTAAGFTIQPGSTTANVSVMVQGDNTYELDEEFFVNLSQPVNVRLGDAQAKATILNDDQIPRVSMFGSFAVEGDYGVTNTNLTINLTNPSYLPVTLNLITSNGNASAGIDYVASDRQITIQPGQQGQIVQFQIIGDAVKEPSESFFVNVYEPVNATLASPQTSITIQDDDSTIFDYDGDGRAEYSVYRPALNTWHILRPTGGITARQFGIEGDLLAPADYDGDRRTDIAVFRPSNGTWYVIMSQSQTFQTFGWGVDGDIPIPADRDGDGKADLVVYRQSNNTWYTRFANATFESTVFGVAGDRPVAGDYDGDGRGDIAVFRPSQSKWYISRSALGYIVHSWGEPGDIPVPADYDGDGKTDLATFRPSAGQWFRSLSGGGADVVNWGVDGDRPASADFDGDGKADVTVFRPSNSTWYTVGTTSGIRVRAFGAAGDIATPGSFIY